MSAPHPPSIFRFFIQPDWLVEDYEGQLPCLVDGKEAYTESANVVDYIEYFYPEPTLSIKGSDAVAKVWWRERERESKGGVGNGLMPSSLTPTQPIAIQSIPT